MQIKELLSNDLKPIRPGMKVSEALDQLNGFGIPHLPVVNEGKVSGILSVENIYAANAESTIDAYIESDKIHRVYENIHEFELIRFFGQTEYTTLGVVNAADEFIGIVSVIDLVKEMHLRFNRLQPEGDTGGILTLEVGRNDFYLSEIARIVESNDTKIIAMYVGQPFENSPTLEVSLHLNRPDVRSLLATFERFRYNVKASHISEEDWVQLQERFNSLMRYINL